ncbi:MAG: cell envelope integrity protein TolA [Gammaproteobacteria bacterium]
MRVNRFRSIRSLALAIGIHVLAIGLLIVSLEFTPPPAGQPQGTEVVQAVTVDEHKVQAEVERLEQAERRKRDQELARRGAALRELATAKAKRQAEERRLAEVRKERDAVAKATAAEQKQLEATEAKRKQEESKRRQEEERRVALEKQRLEEETERAEARLAEEKRKQTEAKAEAEKERKEAEAEAEKKRKETEAKAEAEKKRQEEKRLARQLAERIEADEQAARDRSEIDRFTRLIKTQIENAFTNPQSGLSCTLLVKMVPGGDVVDAKVVRSSGNVLFDRRAEIAVHKASPLPVPDDPRLFQRMREIEFIFDPQA